MTPPTLRQRVPTAPGLYWYTLGETCPLRWCRVVEHEGVLALGTENVGGSGGFKPVTQLWYRFWAGPLLEPMK